MTLWPLRLRFSALAEGLHPRAARRLYVPLSLFGWLVIIGLVLYVTVMDIGRYLV